MIHNYNTTEDCLELFVGLREDIEFNIDASDIGFLTSIARQIFKGIAFTDRQYTVVKEKLIKYNDQFLLAGIDDLENRLQVLRTPLRIIDRSKYLKLEDNKLILRFPFSKKLIIKLESITSKFRGYHTHVKGSHQHIFKFKERILEEIIDTFQNNGFDIDKKLIDFYTQIKAIRVSPQNYVPSLYQYNLRNLANEHVQTLHNMFGKPCKSNLVFYQDRSILYNLNVLDNYKKQDNLLHKIANRSRHSIQVNPDQYDICQMFTTLIQLKRLPILIGLNENECLEQLEHLHKTLYYLNPNLKHSVLFRLPNDDDGLDFNLYIKNNNLNVSLDKSVDIVYINIDSNKIPKPLIESKIKFQSSLTLDSGYTGRIISSYVYNVCDLSIAYSKEISLMLKKQFEEI